MQFLLVRAAVMLCFGIGCEGFVSSDEPTPAVDSRLDYLLTRLQALTVQAGERPTVLQSKPLFRWQNPVSGANGAICVWTLQERPVVLSKSHLNDRKQHYVESLVAVSPQPIQVDKGSQSYWSSPKCDTPPATLMDANVPADTERMRLTQMRDIARQYRVTSHWGEDNRSEWELRLLTTPLYRYRSPETDVIDGAVFAYVQGTNPEAVVIVEAVSTPAGNRWQALPHRLTGYAIKAWYRNQLVLDVPYIQHAPNNLAFFNQYERLQPYPFQVVPRGP